GDLQCVLGVLAQLGIALIGVGRCGERGIGSSCGERLRDDGVEVLAPVRMTTIAHLRVQLADDLGIACDASRLDDPAHTMALVVRMLVVSQFFSLVDDLQADATPIDGEAPGLGDLGSPPAGHPAPRADRVEIELYVRLLSTHSLT